jgi:hypothetical protein
MSSTISTYNLASLGLEEYEENELVLSTIHDLTQFFNNKENCSCRSSKKDTRKCFKRVGFKRFFQRHLEVRGLEKSELELFLKAQLISFEISNEKGNNESSSKVSYRYNFNVSLSLCRAVYLKLNGITEYFLSAIQNHLHENGLKERVHGNTGHSPKLSSRAFINYEVSSIVKQFLIQYSNTCGLPSPMRHKIDSDVFIYLPTNKSYRSIYQEYENYFSIEYPDNKIISYDSFIKLWHELTPHIKFQSPASDLCETCTEFKAKLALLKNDTEQYDMVSFQYKEHREVADIEREHYNNNINESINDLSIAHVCYDWAQNVSIPYSPQQVGSIFFKNTFSVHLFGVCKTEEGQNFQLNFMIGEDELPEGTAKGANTTLNLVYHFLKKFAKEGKKHLRVTCDNCPGQNKNNLSLWFWAWLIMLKWYDDITVSFMIPGHTKFICDSFFGKIKKVYWKTKINTMDDIEQVVNISAEGNTAMRYKDSLGWVWYDFNNFLKPNFKSLPNIKQYHHFRFSNSVDDIGKVYVSTKSGGEETPFLLLNNNNFNANEELNTISTISLTNERKNYLYTKVRQHIDDPYKDVHFSKP